MSMDDPALSRRLDELVEEGTVYQAVSDGGDTIRYIVGRGRHHFGVRIDVDDEEWEEFSAGPAAAHRWLRDAATVTTIEAWGDQDG